ncbi:hypothetical protein [Alteribacter natronophilus]|uniref:hypothetical protein n=1 Tax=Alteribacter natronophilus TaxID=2583810 RepID=UPI00110F2B85|nr:hypothetical protein [Alteribacter natronophilus]TMW72803.1 hypothetical protein FGB90_00370 [Alteribacter natronophilus]
MKYVLYALAGAVLFVVVYVVYSIFNYYLSSYLDYFIYPVYFFAGLIEWMTWFVLPWIGLYWFIRFVKNQQVNKA